MVGQRTLDFPNRNKLVSDFLNSRRQGLSSQTIKFYKGYLNRSIAAIGYSITGQDITHFLGSLDCSNGGKHAYYRVLKTFYNWLYSPKSHSSLNSQDNPILYVDGPKREHRIMPSISAEQLEQLLSKVDNIRDQCILRLLFDSGMRLRELTDIKRSDINWDDRTITIIGKGNKQRKAPFTDETGKLLKLYLGDNHDYGNVWGLSVHGVVNMLRRLAQYTGIRCNAHSFRRGFACNLHRKGLSTLDIMHLGGWQDLGMVLRYTRSITFDDCLKHYRDLV